MSAGDVIFGWMPTFFYNQLFVTPAQPRTDCTGKTIIVTGANVGLGKEAARHYVRLNAAKVVLAVRSLSKGEAAANEIERSTNRQGVVEVWQLDLADYSNVKAFAERTKTLKRVDSIVLNAGISTTQYKLIEGNESTITVNVVSTFLLALLMIPVLRKSAEEFKITPTLTIVSSEVHGLTPFPESKSPSIFDTLNNEKTAKMSNRYETSKLLEILACREMLKGHPVAKTKVTINFVNPGWCHSELLREVTNPVVKVLQKLLCRTTEVGSRTLVHAGLAGPETHGKYLSNTKITPCAPLVEGKQGAELERRVWTELAEKLEHIQPGVTKLIDA